MPEPKANEAKPYHHGDLRRALVEAARQLVETEGPSAMSLRAVARQAGVSPAAPYHHFKDKSELLAAVAAEGWTMLGQDVMAAMDARPNDSTPAQLAYVCFARAHPALYRVMFDAARNDELLPLLNASGDAAFERVRANVAREAQSANPTDLGISVTATWSLAHGLAEMAGFKEFEHLKEELGGEVPFLEAVLRRMHLRLATS